jgi:hypothetical protein
MDITVPRTSLALATDSYIRLDVRNYFGRHASRGLAGGLAPLSFLFVRQAAGVVSNYKASIRDL